MDRIPRKFGRPSADFDMQVGTASAVLSHGFVSESLRREERKHDAFNVARGAVNALLISFVFWFAVGLLLLLIS